MNVVNTTAGTMNVTYLRFDPPEDSPPLGVREPRRPLLPTLSGSAIAGFDSPGEGVLDRTGLKDEAS